MKRHEVKERNGEFRRKLLERLDRPMSFIGEMGGRSVVLGGKRVDIEDLLEGGFGSSEKDILGELDERYNTIKGLLEGEDLTVDEASSLFEEGVTVKRVIYIISRKGTIPEEEDPNEDMKRWLKYSRRIS